MSFIHGNTDLTKNRKIISCKVFMFTAISQQNCICLTHPWFMVSFFPPRVSPEYITFFPLILQHLCKKAPEMDVSCIFLSLWKWQLICCLVTAELLMSPGSPATVGLGSIWHPLPWTCADSPVIWCAGRTVGLCCSFLGSCYIFIVLNCHQVFSSLPIHTPACWLPLCAGMGGRWRATCGGWWVLRDCCRSYFCIVPLSHLLTPTPLPIIVFFFFLQDIWCRFSLPPPHFLF